ncbi:MAG: hypothetical protein R3A80_03110 [Bdellovibrionota bacterium]
MRKKLDCLLGFLILLLSFAAQAGEFCHNVSLLIRLGDKKSCYQGHAGVGLDDEYYDWGPSDDTKSDFFYYLLGDKGQPYEDIRMRSDFTRKDLATVDDIRRSLSGPLNICAAYEVRIRVNEEEAALLKYYWDFIYEKRPYFHIFKNQCTNIAFSSLKYAGLFNHGRVVLLPKTLLKKAQQELVSTCGKEKGQPAKIYQLKK